jgi:vacuolar-type H+-ATPase subunit H
MREIIQKIIASENEAKEIVEEAGIEADRILANARRRASEILDQALAEARAETKKIVEEATKVAEEEKQRRLEEARDRLEREVSMDEAARELSIQEVVRCVCGLR